MLRSRIRGGQAYLTDRVATAAQFLTLRLILLGSTQVGCADSDGPGHAPRYLYVRPKSMIKKIIWMTLWPLSELIYSAEEMGIEDTQVSWKWSGIIILIVVIGYAILLVYLKA